MGTADHLDSHLPGTRAALRDGTLSLGKARIIAIATGLLDPDEARAAENEVLDRAGRLTPGGLRAAIARAVLEVAPAKARERRETAAKVRPGGAVARGLRQRRPDGPRTAPGRGAGAWTSGSLSGPGNWKAGLEGGMDEIRARAYLDLVLGKDSRPARQAAGTPPRTRRTPAARQRRPGTGPAPAPGGFAGRVMLTVPLATLTGLADRPGELSGLGPVDPWLARDLAPPPRPESEDDVVRDGDRPEGHAVGHGCARPEPKSHGKRAGPGRRRAGPGSASPRPAGTARPKGTAPGGCAPRAAART